MGKEGQSRGPLPQVIRKRLIRPVLEFMQSQAVGGIVLIAVADHLPPAVTDDPDTIEIGRWQWTVPATAAPRLLVARKVRA